MTRKTICEIPNNFQIQENTNRITHTFSFELITPMFGGDSESWQIDKENPVRSQSVKGQLRFWWRCMQTETNPNNLRYKENKIWGGKFSDRDEDRKKSSVSLSITNQVVKNEDIVQAEMENNHSVRDNVMPRYVLFPITQIVKDNKHSVHFIKNVSFELNITCEKQYENDVLNTLKLWTLFGGVGARTRRGTGSLYCKTLLEQFKNEEDIAKFIKSLISEGEVIKKYPTLANSLFAVKSVGHGNPSSAWKSFLESYGDYRQFPPGRGRSFWPEPDAIRKITKTYRKHQPNHPDGIWFPRAAFGMPIQIEFRNDKSDPSGKFNIQPDIGTDDRLPSPVILKVIKLSNGNVYQVALVLGQEFPKKLKLNNNPLRDSALPTQTQGKVMINNGNPKYALNGRSVYQALIEHLNLKVVP